MRPAFFLTEGNVVQTDISSVRQYDRVVSRCKYNNRKKSYHDLL
jgi:hypothetical protein